MFAAGVVAGCEVGGNLHAGVVGVDEGAALEHFGYKGAHEGFGRGVVIWIGPGGHALPEVVDGKQWAESPAAILTAAVAMEVGPLAEDGGAGLVGFSIVLLHEAARAGGSAGEADGVPGGPIDAANHRAPSSRGLVPGMTAAF